MELEHQLTSTPVQNFVGETPVDSFPAEVIQKPSEEEIAKKEAQRLASGAKEGGAAKREGAATQDPATFDTQGRGGYGDPKPVNDPMI